MSQKQTEIPGTERVAHPDVEEQAALLHEIVKRRLSIQAQEKEQHAKVVEQMKAHGLTVHKYMSDEGKPMLIRLKTELKASVRLEKNAKNDDDEENEEPAGPN